MFQITNSLDFILCPFLRKGHSCLRSHCVFNHRSPNHKDRFKNAQKYPGGVLLPNLAAVDERKSDLEYDPIDNFAVSGLSPTKVTVPSYDPNFVFNTYAPFPTTNSYLSGVSKSNAQNLSNLALCQSVTTKTDQSIQVEDEQTLKKRGCETLDEQNLTSEASSSKKAKSDKPSNTKSKKSEVTPKESPNKKKTEPVKRKVVSEVDFLSIEEGGTDFPKKKRKKEKSTKEKKSSKDTELKNQDSEEMTVIDIRDDLDNSDQEIEHSNSDQEWPEIQPKITIPFPVKEERKAKTSSPYDLMQKRLQLLGQLKASLTKPIKSKFSSVVSNSVPSASDITKASTINSLQTSVVNGSESTIPVSAPVCKSRVAHQPKDQIAENGQLVLNSNSPSYAEAAKVAKPPIIDPKAGSAKIPILVRQQYLNKFFEQYQRLTSDKDAYTKSSEAEKAIYDRINSKAVYLSSCVNALKRLTSMTKSDFAAESESKSSSSSSKESKSSVWSKSVSHSQVLFGSKYSLVTQNAKKSTSSGNQLKVSGEQFYKLCERFCLTEEQLKEHGFPGFGESKKKVFKLAELENVGVNDIEERICARYVT